MSIDCQAKVGYIPCKIGDVVEITTPSREKTVGKVSDIFFIQSVLENKGFFALALDDNADLVTINDFDVVEVLDKGEESM